MPGRPPDEFEAYFKYCCTSIACMVNNDFPRYIEIVDVNGHIVKQEYAVGNFYVKVGEDISLVYKLISCMLQDEVKIARALWLNPENSEQTLDKLKMLITFS